MSLKDKLRSVNRRFRKAQLYDKAYRRLHATYKQIGQDKGAAYYHAKYDAYPVRSGLVVLDSFWGRTIGCNPFALYKQMRLDPRCAGFRYIWVCNDKSIIPAEVRKDPAVSFVTYRSIPYHRALLEAQYLIGNCNFPPYFSKKSDQVYINTWHGTPIKCIGRDADKAFVASANTQRNYFCSDYILSYSAAMTRRAIISYGAESAVENVYEIGTPRIDQTLSTSRIQAREILKVSGDKDVLLYAPTWRGDFNNKNTDLKEQIDAIKSVLAAFADTHEVFVSVHHITATALKKQNIRLRTVPNNVPVNVVLAGVDMLISDYSSIVVDYLALDRPIALYCPDYADFTARQGVYDDLRDLPLAFCDTLDALKAAVAAGRKPSAFESYAKHKARLVTHEDGKASVRALDIIFGDKPTPAYPRDKRTRVLFYAGGLIPNGITSSIVALSNAIDHTRYDVSVVFDAATVDGNIDRQINVQKLHPACHLITRAGVTTYTPEERDAYRCFAKKGAFESPAQEALFDAVFDRETARIFGNLHFDVAIDFSGYGIFWSTIISKVNASKKLIYQHNDMYREAYNGDAARSFPELTSVFSLYKRFDGVVSVTPEMSPVNRKNLEKYYRPDTKFLAAQNLISPETIIKRARVPLSLASPQVDSIVARTPHYRFCCVARLSPEKNHMRLLAAFAKVLKKNPECVLLILGSGKIADRLHKEAQRLDVQDYVVFLGHCENPYPVIAASDCMVLASHYEGQGIVLLEALVLGVRCIATDNPAIRNVLKNGKGKIVPQDTNALADAMLAASLEKDPEPILFDAETYSESALEQFYRCLEM